VNRVSRQYSYHLFDSLGWQKNSILHLLELARAEGEVARVISLRKLLPIWAMPNGILIRVLSQTFLKFTKMPWAVSGGGRPCCLHP